MPVTILRTANGVLDAVDQPALDTLQQRLTTDSKKILLHLHGGLVSQSNGEAVAAALSGSGPLSYNAGGDYEQIYVVWRTGALETIRINWQDLFNNDQLYRTLFKRLIAYVAGKVIGTEPIGRSVGLAAGLSQAEIERRMTSTDDEPFADLDRMAEADPIGRSVITKQISDQQIEAEFKLVLQSSRDFTSVAEDIAASMDWSSEGRSGAAPPHGDAARGKLSLARLSDGVQAELKGERDAAGRGLITSATTLMALIRHATSIAKRVIGRLRNGRGHGIHATIVEEILRELYGDRVGSTIWGMMKTDASDHFGQGKLGSALLDLVAGSNHQLIITGHSAGSIWASAFLRAAAKASAFPQVKLVLLAPAVRIIEFAAALDEARQLVSTLRIFTMYDSLEKQDPVMGKGTGAIYPSSLLYLVSGLFETTDGSAAPDAPILGMERFIGRDPGWLNDPAEEQAINTVRTYLAGVANSVVYSQSNAGAGLSTDAISHGGFDNNPLTLASVNSLL